jgi:hypothetical protein
MALTPHDAYREGAKQNVSYAVAGGLSAQSNAFGAQTYFIRICAAGVVGASIDGVRISVGDNPTASATTTLLPVQWVEYIKCSPGQKIAVLGNAASTGTLNVTELTD